MSSGECSYMKILLVEDHQESRHNLQRLIERRGHHVVGVGSAEEAKRCLKADKFPFLIPEAERLLGRKRDDLIGKELWREFPELIGSPFEENYRRVLTEQVAIEFEASDSIGKIWFEMHAYPNGPGVSVFFRDVSERK